MVVAGFYTYEDSEWVLKGRYEVAIRDDEEAIWIQISGEYILRMLIVCFFSI